MSFLSFSYETQLYNNVIKIYNNTKIVTTKSSIFIYIVFIKRSCSTFVPQDIQKLLSLVSCFQKIGSIRGGKK